MKPSAKHLAQGAVLGALYAVLTHMQNLLLPGSASWAIQLRLSEALCVLAFFTPAASLGLSIGCLIFNLTFTAALPLDFLLGTLATYLSAEGMWRTRNIRICCLPLLGLCLPALWNGLLVGAQLSLYIGGGFWLNALYIAAGEGIVLLTLGSSLYLYLKRRKLDRFLS